MTPMIEPLLVLRLLGAAVAGLILGLPYRNRPGGVRTPVLVTLGAALFCTTAARYVEGHEGDVLRILQGIASGIGFIGAASVLKKDVYIVGITMAATIWIAAALGCEAGLGVPWLAVILAISVSTLSMALHRFERRFFKPRSHLLVPSDMEEER